MFEAELQTYGYLAIVVLAIVEGEAALVGAAWLAHRGEGPPPSDTPWGFGRWVGHITRNWTDPDFRLGGVFPWLGEADRLMRADDTVALERLILEQAYRRLQRQAGEHEFDFEAVVRYVLKWNIVDRWGRYNSEAAARRFEKLAEAGLGAHARLSFEGEA